MKLYFSPLSAGCRVVALVAKLLDLKINYIIYNRKTKESLQPELTKINPQHTVPTLIDGDFILWESRAIIIYLVEKYGKDDSLYPKDHQIRAKINQFLFFDTDQLYKYFNDFYHDILFKNKPGVPEKYEKAMKALLLLDKFLEGKNFTACDHLTIADVSLAVTISNYEVGKVDLESHKNVLRWYQRCKNLIPGFLSEEDIPKDNYFSRYIHSKL